MLDCCSKAIAAQYRAGVVIDDVGIALARLAAGESVVLIVDPGAPPLGEVPQGPGRLAVVVGPPADPAVRQAAHAMDRELFGSK